MEFARVLVETNLSEFKNLLIRAGLNKMKLAQHLGLNPRTVSAWGSSPPDYATAYLKLLIAHNRIAPLPYVITE